MNQNDLFILSGRGVQRFSSCFEKDFCIYLNDTPLKIPKCGACFFSSKISNYLSSDHTFSQYSIKLSQNPNEKQIKLIENLISGKEIEITEDNSDFLLEIGEKIGNKEIIQASLGKILEGKEITQENCFKRLLKKNKNQINSEEEEKFIANHFEEFSKEEMKQLEISEMEKIFRREDLRISSEDKLIEIIKELGKDFVVLLRNIQIENLSTNGIKTFIETVNENNLINEVWNNVCVGLMNVINCDKWNWKCQKKIEIKYTGEEMKGILAHLQESCTGNLQEKGIVNVSSWAGCHAHEILNWKYTGYNNYLNEPNLWIQYDMIDKRIKLTHLTIKNNYSAYHLEHFKILGSNDGKTFELIEEKNVSNPNGSAMLKIYDVKQNDKSYQIIRIQQTGPNSSNTNHFFYSNFEFFGTLEI